MTDKTNSRAGLFYALAAAIGLGAITTQAKLVYADGGNAMTLMLWRYVVSVAVIGLILLVKKQSFKVSGELKWPVVLLGVMWSGAMIAYLQSVQTISVSIAVLIFYSYPIIVMLVSILTGRLRASVTVLVLFVLAFTGIALMLFSGNMVLHPYGVAFAAIAACGAAYTFLVGSRVAPLLNPDTLTFWVNLAGLVMIIPLIYGQYRMPVSAAGMGILILATLCYIVAILCQFQALSRMSAARAAFILNTEPVVSILLALLILNETLSLIQWVGVLIVITVLFVFTKVTSSEGKG